MAPPEYNEELIEVVAARLDLRNPNKQALRAVAAEIAASRSWTKGTTSDFVLDLATGVGKTYIAGALVDYLYMSGLSNILFVTPGSQIQSKTIRNFSPGDEKFIAGLDSRPMIVTPDNFRNSDTGAGLQTDRPKLFIFNVQQLIRPSEKAKRQVWEANEWIGASLRDYLLDSEDLIIIADEHHAYFGPSFSAAIRSLDPRLVIGLTATPHEKTPGEWIIYKYPLAAAIADGYVKVPVLVARRDGQTEVDRQLADGLVLLNYKAKALAAYTERESLPPVRPVMFVVCSDISEAEEVAAILRSPSFFDSNEAVLSIHSRSTDDALALLDEVDEQTSDVRVIVSVQMLKEGWDVKNIYVIAALRAMESKVLSEQILGRGLRLPFGSRTGVSLLDTVEVLSHRRFSELLERADSLLEATFDKSGVVVLSGGNIGDEPLDPTNSSPSEVNECLHEGEGRASVSPTRADGFVTPEGSSADEATPAASFVETGTRVAEAEEALRHVGELLLPDPTFGTFTFPRLEAFLIPAMFSLSDVPDQDALSLGGRYLKEFESSLRRVGLDAKREEGGRLSLVRTKQEALRGSQSMLPVTSLVDEVVRAILRSGLVEVTNKEKRAARRITNSFLRGAGVDGEAVESAMWSEERIDAAANTLTGLIREHYRDRPSTLQNKINLVDFPSDRIAHPGTSTSFLDIHRSAQFKATHPYSGWAKCMYPLASFDAYATEFRLAGLVDDAAEVFCWTRIRTGREIFLRWDNNRRYYYPDFLVIENSGRRWLVEAKSDQNANDPEVVAKREAAAQWVRHVNDSGEADAEWSYLFATEREIRSSGSWPALKAQSLTY